MNLEDLYIEVKSLRKSFREPKKIECLYIDKHGKTCPIEHIDAVFYGKADDNKLTVLLYEEKPNETEELPFNDH